MVPKKVSNRTCFAVNFAKYFRAGFCCCCCCCFWGFFIEYYLLKYLNTSSIREFNSGQKLTFRQCVNTLLEGSTVILILIN